MLDKTDPKTITGLATLALSALLFVGTIVLWVFAYLHVPENDRDATKVAMTAGGCACAIAGLFTFLHALDTIDGGSRLS